MTWWGFPKGFTTDPSKFSNGIIIMGKLMTVYSVMDASLHRVLNGGDGSGGASIAWRTLIYSTHFHMACISTYLTMSGSAFCFFTFASKFWHFLTQIPEYFAFFLFLTSKFNFNKSVKGLFFTPQNMGIAALPLSLCSVWIFLFISELKY